MQQTAPTQKRLPPWLPYAIGAVLLLGTSALILAMIVGGKTRKPMVTPPTTTSTTTGVPATSLLVPRRLDGVLVPVGDDKFKPRAVMVENHPDARPLSGLSSASVVIEAPVEGGITRFMALFDATTTVTEVGPVRSARPYYVDWADGWKASYFHVGGSPEALDKINKISGFTNVDEMATGDGFWRDNTRYAPHNVYTKSSLMAAVIERKGQASSTEPIAWRFQDAATSTSAFGTVKTIRVTYGGSYNVTWKFDAEQGVYVRSQGKQVQKSRDGSEITVQNVIVTKTDQQVLDSVGRLKVRTTGSGEAVAYRDGKKFTIRWRRSPGEPMRFENTDGSDFILNRGKTWISVTTDDKVFAGIE